MVEGEEGRHARNIKTSCGRSQEAETKEGAIRQGVHINSEKGDWLDTHSH